MITPSAKTQIDFGNRYPFDAPDSWKERADTFPPPPEDWAHSAARAIIADLLDRRGIKQELREIDEDIRIEIVQKFRKIILVAFDSKSSEKVCELPSFEPVMITRHKDDWLNLQDIAAASQRLCEAVTMRMSADEAEGKAVWEMFQAHKATIEALIRRPATEQKHQL